MNACAPTPTKEVHSINWLLIGLLLLLVLALSISPVVAAAKSINWAFPSYHVDDQPMMPVVPVRAPTPPDVSLGSLLASTPEPVHIQASLNPVPLAVPTPPPAPLRAPLHAP